MIRPFQLGRSNREESEAELPTLELVLDAATSFAMSTRLNNLLTIQPKLRESVSDSLNTSLDGSIYSVHTSANGSNPSRVFNLTLSKSLSTIEKVWAICAGVAEIELHAKGLLHHREYSDGVTRFSWVPEKTKHTLDATDKPWKPVVLNRAIDIFTSLPRELLMCELPKPKPRGSWGEGKPKRLVLRDYLVREAVA